MHLMIPRNPVRLRSAARWLSGLLLLLLLPVWVSATSVVPPSFEKLVNESDYVVRAVVKSVTSDWREKNGQRRIYTFVELEVREVIAGNPPSPLVLQMLGGRIDGEELVIEGAPKFEVGQEDILFVRNNGKQFYPLTAIMHGRYPILKDATGRVYVARANKAPLTTAAQVSEPMASGATDAKTMSTMTASALSPESFAHAIRAAVNPNARPARAK